MTPMLLECRGTCRDVTLHQSRTEGHSECSYCGTKRRDTTCSMDGNETMAMWWASRGAENFTEVGHE